jgi:hypothetical protein
LPEQRVALCVIVPIGILERDHAVGVAANHGRADLAQPLEHALRPWAIHAEVPRGDDPIGAALRREVGQARVECHGVAVEIGEDRDAHGAS